MNSLHTAPAPPTATVWSRLLHDAQFYLALLAGVVVITSLSLLQPPHPGWPPFWPYLQLALLFPVLEEYLFRGLLQEAITARYPNRLGPLSHANLTTSVLFALAHLPNHPPIWALSVFFPSLVFGHFRERYHHLLPHTLLHCLYNSSYFLLYPPA